MVFLVFLLKLTLRLLISSVEFSVQIPKLEVNSDNETPEAMVTFIVDGCWTKACIQRMINKFLLKHMVDAMGKETFVQKEWVDLLREMVLKLPEVLNLHSFRILYYLNVLIKLDQWKML